ncbi:MAG: M20/M25/M40 family metallo-hydrolase, partial [Saprospiraceae bacterium]|nr:M20/M25/M40 family metallo-hydrolase [Saprospiraceae bacterium]
MLQKLKIESIELLKTHISIPSFSKEENKTADCVQSFFQKKSIPTFRKGNNVWIKNKSWNDSLPTILLNSHHDTVRPVKAWTKNPHEPLIENGKLFGLGSNDAGGCLVSLIATFLFFYEKENLNYNIILAATAEEEISGKNGIASVVDDFGKIDFGIIGEPTEMQMAIAEKGLMVVDGIAKGKAGHAAREEGINAIYEVLEDLEWIRNYKFEKVSDQL